MSVIIHLYKNLDAKLKNNKKNKLSHQMELNSSLNH